MITVIPETPPQSDSESDVFNGDDSAEASIEEIEHKVTFKCISCTKEQCYQETLKRVAQLRRGGNVMEAKLEPEPTNPFDAKAIQIKINVKWMGPGRRSAIWYLRFLMKFTRLLQAIVS